MRIIGITGGTGSGKSEAARMFAACGMPVLDADALGHELIGPGGPAEQAVREAFGEAILVDGRIDRARLASIVFGDPAARQRLNVIVHPRIYGEIAKRCAALAEAGHAVALVDAALLAEAGRRDPWLDGLILVLCPQETRVRRLVECRGFTQEEALARIRAQTPPETKLPCADWVIENDDGLDLLRAQVEQILKELQ